MGNVIKIEVFIYGLLLNFGCILTYDPATCVRCRESHICNPPACFCCRDTMPLETNKIPQMVFFSFDDAVNPPVAKFYRELFDSKRLNPNGCPISLTLFVSHQNTVYKLVQEFYQKGFEIASHSVTHAHMNAVLLREEAMKQKENLAKRAKIPIGKITGWRSPFLEPVGDLQPSILKDLGYEYDATLTFTKKNGNDSAVTPFTLDFGWPYDCKIKSCPNQAHKGFWEVPVVSVKDYKNKYDCVYVDGCNIPPPSENLAFKFLWDNFQRYYTTNRAPMGINMHASWFYYPDRKRAMNRFIKELVKLDDVYIVSIKQVIEWLKDPTPLNQLRSFQPWSCSYDNTTTTTSQANPNTFNNRYLTKAPTPASRSKQWNQRRSRTSRPVGPSDAHSQPPLVPNLPMIQFWWHRPGGQMQRRVDRERNLRQQEEQRQEKRRRQRAEEERLRKLVLEKQAEAKRLEQQRQERLRKQELARQVEIKRKTELEKKRLQAKRLEDLKKKQLEKQKQLEIEKQKLKEQQVIAATKVENFRQQQLQKEQSQTLAVIPRADNRFFSKPRSSRTMGMFMGMQNRGSRFSQPVVDNRLSTNVRKALQRKQYLQNELLTSNRDTSVAPKMTTAHADTANVLENSFNLFISRKLDKILKFPASKRTKHLEQMSLPELRALQSELSNRLVTKRRPDSSTSSRHITQTPDVRKTSLNAHNSPVLREFHNSNDVIKTKLPVQETIRQLETKKSEMFGVPKPILMKTLVQQIVSTTLRPVLTDAPTTMPTTTTTTTAQTTTATTVPTTTQTTTTTTQKTTTQPTTTSATTTTTTTTATTTATEAPTTAAPTTKKITTVATTTKDVRIPANPIWILNEAGMQNGQIPWQKWITKAPAFSMVTSPTTKPTTPKATPSVVKLFSIDGFNLESAFTLSKPNPKPIFLNENDIKDHVNIWKYTDSSSNVNNALVGASKVSTENAVPAPSQTKVQDASIRMPDIMINDNPNRMPDLSVNLESFSNFPSMSIPVASSDLDPIAPWAIAPKSETSHGSDNSVTIRSIDLTTSTTTLPTTTATEPTTTSSTTTPTTTTTVPTTTPTTTPAVTTRATTKLTTTDRVTPTSFRAKFDQLRKNPKEHNRGKHILKSFVIPKLSSTKSSKIEIQSSPKTSKVVYQSSPSWLTSSPHSKATTPTDRICRQEVNCMRPTCVCKSHSAPTPLKTEDVPQIVYITVDGSLNFHTFGKLRSLFSKTRLNPNGCKIKGTMFVTDTGSSYRIANVLKSEGLELGLMGMSSRPYRRATKLKRDIMNQRKRVANSANMLPSDVKGWRSPGFTPVGDEQYNILSNHSLYDSSLLLAAREKDDPILWPHTLDFGWGNSCQMGTCPRQRHAGVWEVPILPYSGPNNSSACEYTDGCVRQPLSEEETLSYLRENFNLHYRNGKAPFAIRLKQIWFHWYYRANFSGLLKFLDEILNRNDVYITSVSDMLEWMKSPVPLKQIKQFEPWQC